MRKLLLAAAIAVLTGPLTAYGAPGVMQLSQLSAPVLPEPDSFDRGAPVLSTHLRPPVPAQPEQFIGTYPLHNGLLPNGLEPNPPTYG